MKKTKLIEGLFEMKFEEIYSRFQSNRLTCEEAAEILGVSIRTFHRKRQRYEDEDFNGCFDKRFGKPAPNRSADWEVKMITKLYEMHYQDFSVKHFYSFMRRKHNLRRSYSWTKTALLKAGLIQKNKQGGIHRIRRERRPMEGMMLHQDGSTHQWIPALDYNLDLIVTMDDATSKITSAFLTDQEGINSSFKGLQETIEKYGIFCSMYTDRGSHYFYTPEAGKTVDKNRLTQVGRALKQLGIQHIAAYSPEARGRSERMFGTLQSRLPKEFSLYNIADVEPANCYLKDEYIARHNDEFSVPAVSLETAYVPWIGKSLNEILCIQDARTVQGDNTIQYNGLVLQIPKNEHRNNYVRTRVEVHQYSDDSLAIFYGHLCLGRYTAKGVLIQDPLKEVKRG
jgi:transposase